MQRSAIISDCGKFRYRLTRRWGDGKALAFIMLNPSTADGEADDATIRKCIGFANKHGYKAIEVVNLFAYRATKPSDLKKSGYPIGEENNDHIVRAITDAGKVVLGWGANARDQVKRVREILSICWLCRVTPYALKLTSDGIPSHPLMLPYSCELTKFKQ